MVCFPSFLLFVCWCTTSCTVITVLWQKLMEPINAPARWRPCACLKCVSGLQRLEKNLEVFEMHTCHWPGAQIWFKHKWGKLVTASLLLDFIDWYSCLRYWNEFFQLWFRFYFEVLSYCSLTETFAIGFQKWLDHEWIDFGVFCWELASLVDFISVRTEICKRCSIVILFWRHQIFSVFSLRGILVCSLKMFLTFSHRFLYYGLISFRKAMQLSFQSFSSSSLFFLEVVVNVVDYFWKPNSLFSKFCVNCLLMFYFVYCNNCVLNDVNGARWCTCSLVALRMPEMCLWPAKTRKNLELFEMHTGHWPGAQLWFRHKWGKLVTASPLVPCIVGYKYRRYWNEVFFSCVSCFRLKFSPIALWRKRLQLDSESDLTTNGLILGFFVGKRVLSSTSYLYGLNLARDAQLFFYFDDINFFDV